VKFRPDDIRNLLTIEGCNCIGFIPLFITHRYGEEVDNNGIVIIERRSMLIETLAAFPLKGDQVLVNADNPPVYSRDVWPINYPPYASTN